MNRTRPFNLRMDTLTRERLDTLRKQQDLSGAQLVRQLINDRWETLHANAPKCASGAPCCMPTLYLQGHGIAPAPRQPSIDAHVDPKKIHELFEEGPPPVPNWSPAQT